MHACIKSDRTDISISIEQYFIIGIHDSCDHYQLSDLNRVEFGIKSIELYLFIVSGFLLAVLQCCHVNPILCMSWRAANSQNNFWGVCQVWNRVARVVDLFHFLNIEYCIVTIIEHKIKVHA